MPLAGGAERPAGHRLARRDVRARRLLARGNAPAVRPAGGADPRCSTSWSTWASSRSSWCPPRRNRPARTRWRRRASTAAAGSASTCNRPKPPSVRDAIDDRTRRRPRCSRSGRRTTRSGRSILPAASTIGRDRRQPLGELMNRGYEDAYHQFIEPVVGASGERVGHQKLITS